MGKRHAAAQAGIARAQADETIREAEARRGSAERERQLLTSYLGTEDQINGTGAFAGATPEALKYTQRYSVDQRTLNEIQAAGSGVKNQLNPFQSGDNATRGGQSLTDYGQGFATKANDLLAQAEALARAGDTAGAEQLYAQAQQIISGVSPEAQGAFNLGGGENSAAQIRASSTEGRIVGRQLLTAQQLGDPNSATSTALRGRLLDPALGAIQEGTGKVISEIDASELSARKAIDENTRNAERAITAERSQVEGEIRQRAAGGPGFNPNARIAAQAQVASAAARQRADVYSQAAQEAARVASDAGLTRAQAYAQESAQRSSLIAQVDVYLNEFSKRFAEDSVTMAQQWVAGTAGVRDNYQAALDQFDLFQAQLQNQFANTLQRDAQLLREQEKSKKAFKREALFGFATGSLPISTIFGGGGVQFGSSSGQKAGTSTAVGGGVSSGVGSEEGKNFGLGDFGEQDGGGGGGGGLASLGSLLALA